MRVRHTPSRSTVAFLVLVVVATGFALALALRAGADNQPAPPSTRPTAAPSAGAAPSTTGIVQPSQITRPGGGPEAFTTLTAPGPVQVLVTAADCVGYVGDGWWISWKVTNQGAAREGALLAQVDNSGPQVVFVPNLQLPADSQASQRQATGPAAGDSVTLTWANADQPVKSAVFEVPHCPQDPKDLADARRATTTT